MDKPEIGVIKARPHIAVKDGHLVMIVEHLFEDMPAWVEWDEKKQVLRISQMGGQVDIVKAKISPEHCAEIKGRRKMLLVTNFRGEKIIHFVPFIIRG